MVGVITLMDEKLSVIITARNEILLQKTISSVLGAAKGSVEVIVILDGYEPDTPLFEDYRVTVIRNRTSLGQRQSINAGCRVATGKYMMKLDAHCAVAPGFDEILKRDCEYDWTMVPRMYNLDPTTFAPKKHKRTDFMYISGPNFHKPFRAMYYGNYGGIRTPKPSSDKMIDETMCCMGPGWFMHMDRFWELGGCDEAHGGWGQQGVEVALKAWLSGGKLMVNKNTWFAHWFRGGGVPEGFKKGFPYRITSKDVSKARKHSQRLWLGGQWEKQVRSVEWLAEKFDAPTWSDLTVVYYTANRVPDYMGDKVRANILKTASKHPIISVSKIPINMGANTVVDLPYEAWSIYKQLTVGVKQAKTKYVALVEDDCLYTKEHFDYRPPDGVFGYNHNRYNLLSEREIEFSMRDRHVLSQCICEKDLLLAAMKEREKVKPPPELCGEFGVDRYERAMGVTERKSEAFRTKGKPNIVLCHKTNIGGRKLGTKDTKHEIEGWGKATDMVDEYIRPRETPKLSVVIPSYMDPHLHKTIQSILDNFTGSYEIIPVIDGYEMEKEFVRDARIMPVYLEENSGMREAINAGVAAARGEYIMRTDEHCMFAKGFDTTILKSIKDDEIVTARRYFLNPRKWQVMEARGYVDYEELRIRERLPPKFASRPWPSRDKARADIMVDETMAWQGSMWMMSKKWWEKVIGKLQSQGYGTHYQDSVEMSFKTWRAGGRIMLNKNTWFAHKHRKFPRTHSYSTKRAEPEWKYSIDTWISDYNELKTRWGLEDMTEGRPEGIDFRRQHSRIAGREECSVEELYNKRLGVGEPHKDKSMLVFWPTFDSFMDAVMEGKTVEDLDDIRVKRYHNYLTSALHPSDIVKLGPERTSDHEVTERGKRHAIGKLSDAFRLVYDIRDNGLKAPLTFYTYGKSRRLAVIRGGRRIIILHKLGVKTVPIRVFSHVDSVRLYDPFTDQWQNKSRLKRLPPIHNLGMRQFNEHSYMATDKYWVHGYTKVYDELWDWKYRQRKLRILELGVLNGYSLKLFHRAFPKSKIIGVDKNATSWKNGIKGLDRIEVMVGDEEDDKFMKGVAANGPYDIIIDDCSHKPGIQWKVFEQMWPYVNSHGYYIVEDCHHSYHHKHKGKQLPTAFAEFVPELYTNHRFEALHFYYNLCVIKKGLR